MVQFELHMFGSPFIKTHIYESISNDTFMFKKKKKKNIRQ